MRCNKHPFRRLEVQLDAAPRGCVLHKNQLSTKWLKLQLLGKPGNGRGSSGGVLDLEGGH
jgi:hypothetical protein